MRHALLLITALAFAFGALAAPAAAAPAPAASGPRAAFSPAGSFCADAEESDFLRLINDYRRQNGLGAMVMSQTLSDAAEHHSVSMADHNYFSHNLIPEGIDWVQNLTNHGYTYNAWKGENIAAGNSAAVDAFNQWKNSPIHNANMLSVNFNAIGIGRAYNANSGYKWYWTNTFGSHVDAAAQVCGTAPAPSPSPSPSPAPAPSPAPTCAAPTTGQAVIYEHANYAGPCHLFTASNPGLHLNTSVNDAASSLKVGASTSVTLCHHPDYTGVCETFTASDADLSNNPVGNDTVTAIRFDVLVAPSPSPSPSASPAPTGGTRLAVRSTTRTSNSNSGTYAVDGNTATAWYTTVRTAPSSAYVYFDLGSSYSIGAIKWMWSQTGSADHVQIQVSTNRTTWTTLTTVGNAAANSWQTFSTRTTARYVRFYFTNPNRDVRLGNLAEVQIFS